MRISVGQRPEVQAAFTAAGHRLGSVEWMRRSRLPSAAVLAVVLAVLSSMTATAAEPPGTQALPAGLAAGGDWKPLFDGQTLAGWEATTFGGEGEVTVTDGAIRIERGSELSGITWKKDFPTEGYAITLEASRIDGYDFFCGLTFPIADEPCSFIVGGWGGGVVGLSSVDGADAAHNDTTEWKEFETGTWYRITVEVGKEAIRCWINDEQLVDQPRKDHEFSLRPEVFLSKPLGISCYGTVAGIRDVRYRLLDAKPAATDSDR